MIRVGTIKYKGGKAIHPSFQNFRPIVVLTKSSPYGQLGPYVLKDEKGRIMENIWQFSKVYKKVPFSKQRYSYYDSKIIWEHPEETHIENGKINRKYLEWRKKGFECEYPVRYPVGKQARSECLYALKEIYEENDEEKGLSDKKLNYVEARVEIYFPVYTRLAKKQPKYRELKKLLEKGENLLIIEVDGPISSSLPYYKEKYGVSDSFIENDTILVTPENMEIMLNDTRHAFGHGYCLAMSLLDIIIV